VPRSAPSVERTVTVLNFLAAHNRDEYSLSELARRSGLSKATCHALVTSLTDAGYVMRHPIRNTYRLGPALIGLGRAAEDSFTAVEFARGEMRRLVDLFQLECMASAVAGNHIVVLEHATLDVPLSISMRVGQRVPLVPPLGTIFVAWAPPQDIDAWLLRLGPEVSEDQMERYRNAVEAVRRRGYTVAVTPRDEAEHEDHVLLELQAASDFRVHLLVAPVFDSAGAVTLALTLFGFAEQLTEEDIPAYAQELCSSARTVTAAIHGKMPTT
jgi:DNA-binding IclR family transcriptional regulator